VLVGRFFNHLLKLCETHLKLEESIDIDCFLAVFDFVLQNHASLHLPEVVVVEELEPDPSLVLLSLFETMKGTELVIEHLVLDVGQQEPDLRGLLVFLTYLLYVLPNELKPEFPLGLELFAGRLHRSAQQTLFHTATDAHFGWFAAVLGVQGEDTFKENDAVRDVPFEG
jgi:hypothetical protein